MAEITVRQRVETVFKAHVGEPAYNAYRNLANPWGIESRTIAGEAAALVPLDSLDKIEFIMAIEDEFGIVIKDEEAVELFSIDQIVEAVEKHLGPQEG